MSTAELKQITIKRKIAVVFADGSRKQNLNVNSMAHMIAEAHVTSIPVDCEPASDSQTLLHDLEQATGYMVKQVAEGTFLSQPTTEPIPVAAMTDAYPEGSEDDQDVPSESATMEVTETRTAGTAPVFVKSEPSMPPASVLDLVESPAFQTKIDLITGTAPEAKVSVTVPTTRTRGGLINLGPREIFTACEKAMAMIHAEWEVKDFPALPGRYHQAFTQTFLNGRAEGQIQSVFRDVKKFGAKNIVGKLTAFKEHFETSTDPLYAKYRAYLNAGLLPHHEESHVPSTVDDKPRVDLNFFKTYALLELQKHYAGQASS